MPSLGAEYSKRVGWRRLWLVLFLACGSVLISERNDQASLINTIPKQLSTPIAHPAQWLSRSIRGILERNATNRNISAELESANGEIQELKSQLIEMARVKEENTLLRKELEFANSRKDLDLIPAQVLSKNDSSFAHRWRVEVSAHGTPAVSPGMVVVASNALIGQVITVSGHLADVMLLSDPRSAVDVRLVGTGTYGLAMGSGDAITKSMRLKYLSGDPVIEDATAVETSGKDGKFPSGLRVGSVNLTADQGPTNVDQLRIEAEAGLSDVKYVFLVRGYSGLSKDGKRYQDTP